METLTVDEMIEKLVAFKNEHPDYLLYGCYIGEVCQPDELVAVCDLVNNRHLILS